MYNIIQLLRKIAAKVYVATICGDKYIIPAVAYYNHVEDIDVYSLPDQFVAKCTHNSGGVVICKDENKFGQTELSRLNEALSDLIEISNTII